MRTHGRIIGWLAIVAGLLAAPAESVEPERRVVLSAVAAEVHGERLRLALALSRRVPFELTLMDDPRRLAIDLPELTWRAGRLPRAPGWLGDVRRGLVRPGQARLVFVLDRPLRIARSFTRPGAPGRAPRLVIDLVPTDAAAFAAAAESTGRGGSEGILDGRKPLTVALDPGHGGRDPGAMFGTVVEKRVVLAFARELADAIDLRPGMQAILTRVDDSHVPLGARIDRARRAGADLMISLHADRLAAGGADGVTIYSLGPGTGRRGPAVTTESLVRGRARDTLLAGTGLAGESDALAETLVGLARRDTVPASEGLARSLLSALDGAVALLDKRPHRHGAFAVLKAADLPAVLVELGFIDNGIDRGRLRSAEWRQTTIGALIRGIERWADGAAHTREASRKRSPGAPETSPGGRPTMWRSRGTKRHRDAFAFSSSTRTPAEPTR